MAEIVGFPFCPYCRSAVYPNAMSSTDIVSCG
jgi:hypothetical protein